MKITRTITIAVVGVAAASGSLLLAHASASTSTPAPPAQTTSAGPSLDAIVAGAADEAGLAQMCVAGQHDANARVRYDTTAAAHPALAQQLGPGCTPVINNP